MQLNHLFHFCDGSVIANIFTNILLDNRIFDLALRYGFLGDGLK